MNVMNMNPRIGSTAKSPDFYMYTELIPRMDPGQAANMLPNVVRLNELWLEDFARDNLWLVVHLRTRLSWLSGDPAKALFKKSIRI
ncbi:hypothetical protein EDD11_009219, partial [Mortierella claussenii]